MMINNLRERESVFFQNEIVKEKVEEDKTKPKKR